MQDQQPTDPHPFGDHDDLPPGKDSTMFAIGFESAIILFAVVLGWMLDVSPLERLAGAGDFLRDVQAVAWGAVAILPLLGMLVVIRTASWAPLRHLNRVVDEQLTPMFAKATLWKLGLVSLAAGLGEELLFRGVLFSKAEYWWNTTTAVVVTSLVFGVCHWVTTTYAVVATVIGLYMAFLLLYFDNILVPIVAHALYDFVALVFLVRKVRGEQQKNGSPEKTGLP